MLINRTLSAFQNLLNLVNSANPNAPVLHVDQVSTSAVSALSSTPELPYNSEVTLTAVSERGFTGQVTVRYNRLAVATQLALHLGNTMMAPSTNAAQCLELVAQQYGLITNEIELVGTFQTPLMVEIVPLNFGLKPISANSLTYTGEEVQVAIVWPDVGDRMHTLLHATLAAPGYL